MTDENIHKLDTMFINQIFERSLAIKFIVDPDTQQIVKANQAAANFYGYTIQQLKQMSVSTINTLSADEITAEMQRARREERLFFEFRHRLASGEIRDVNVYPTPIKHNGKDLLYVIVLDVTSQKETERALRTNQQRYRALFQQSHDAVFILNLSFDHPPLEVNQRAADMLGYTLHELYHLPPWDYIAPTEHSKTAHVIKRLLNGEIVPPYERLLRRKDGTYLPVEINVELVRDGDGNPMHIQSLIRDISARKAEQQRTLDFQFEQERSRLLADFIENVSHEFRTPLSTIATSAYLCSRAPSSDRREERLATIQEQVNRISNLVDMLLLITRVQQDANFTFKDEVLTLILANVIEEYRPRYTQKAISLSTNFRSHLPRVSADADYLYIALAQMLDNAIRYTPVDGSIVISTYVQDDQVIIEFLDSGAGIAPDDIPHIFKRFFRGDESHSSPGFGLGLSLAETIIQQHGGFIDVESKEGRGSRFCVILPASSL